MHGQGVLFGQIAVVFGIVITGVWTATQWTAAALGYATIHAQTYGEAVDATMLIPHMLEAFMAGDRGFRRQKERGKRDSSRAPASDGRQ